MKQCERAITMKSDKRATIIFLVFMLVCCMGKQNNVSAEVPDDLYRNYYEIFVYSYYDSDGDGIGDLRGVEEKLDYIADLGFTGIWLMPVMPSPTYHKYDVMDYKEIDPQYGSLTDFQSLINACHEKDINLIIDLPINHSSAQHPWFWEACEYLRSLESGAEPDAAKCPYVEYYHFAKEPAGSTWYSVEGSEWYYEGSFWEQMPDLNLSCEALKKEIQLYVKKHTAPYKYPRIVEFVDELPKTISGKVIRHLL